MAIGNQMNKYLPVPSNVWLSTLHLKVNWILGGVPTLPISSNSACGSIWLSSINGCIISGFAGIFFAGLWSILSSQRTSSFHEVNSLKRASEATCCQGRGVSPPASSTSILTSPFSLGDWVVLRNFCFLIMYRMALSAALFFAWFLLRPKPHNRYETRAT